MNEDCQLLFNVIYPKLLGTTTGDYNMEQCCNASIGLQCKDNRLLMIQLTSKNLTGYLPSEIGELGSLRHLYLNDNKLQGSIPESFGKLQSLVSLNLQTNLLNGSIPVELGNLSKLKIMNLTGNQFVGLVPKQILNLPNFNESYFGNPKFIDFDAINTPPLVSPTPISNNHGSTSLDSTNLLALIVLVLLFSVLLIALIVVYIQGRKEKDQPKQSSRRFTSGDSLLTIVSLDSSRSSHSNGRVELIEQPHANSPRSTSNIIPNVSNQINSDNNSSDLNSPIINQSSPTFPRRPTPSIVIRRVPSFQLNQSTIHTLNSPIPQQLSVVMEGESEGESQMVSAMTFIDDSENIRVDEIPSVVDSTNTVYHARLS
ncbi:hypothetical protein HDV02_002815 [Globomyces sp. JEL0801]|nr:hypothetical protein HDV02_002815 [Globomyces sp. JEL0801]